MHARSGASEYRRVVFRRGERPDPCPQRSHGRASRRRIRSMDARTLEWHRSWRKDLGAWRNEYEMRSRDRPVCLYLSAQDAGEHRRIADLQRRFRRNRAGRRRDRIPHGSRAGDARRRLSDRGAQRPADDPLRREGPDPAPVSRPVEWRARRVRPSRRRGDKVGRPLDAGPGKRARNGVSDAEGSRRRAVRRFRCNRRNAGDRALRASYGKSR